MLNFTVGPTTTTKRVREIGKEKIPYFRTPEFSKVMLENETLIKKFANAEESSKVVFLTGSGTASMEASLMNVFNENDKLLIINGGSFGDRLSSICSIHDIPFTELKIKQGYPLEEDELYKYDGLEYTGLLVVYDETSTGVLFDLNMISKFTKKNNLIFVVDAISAFLCESFDMKKLGCDVMLSGSQKALACPPGVSLIIFSDKAVNRVKTNKVKSYYFNLKQALKRQEEGQTPFTPAVGTLLQLNARLKDIDEDGGVDSVISKVKSLKKDFNSRIINLPFSEYSKSPSNGVTVLRTENVSAYKVYTLLKDEYSIFVAPCSGDLKEKCLRIGHIGDISINDNIVLVNALKDLNKRVLL